MGRVRTSNLWGKSFVFLVVVGGVLIGGSSAQGKYGGGTGEPNDPYQIWDANHMQAIGADANDWGKCFKLMDDIDLGQFDGKDGRPEFNIVGYIVFDPHREHPFTGVFDGNEHTISNFTYDSSDMGFTGLFGVVDDPNAEIKNLGLIDPNVAVAREFRIGSLVGWLTDGTITNCYSSGSVSGRGYVGGLVGWNEGTITNCYSTARVTGNGSVGGLAGITRSNGTITNCYSNGDVWGDSCVGGLVGENREGAISDCYSTGSVTGARDVGGLVGYHFEGPITDSFWDVNTSGLDSSGGGTGKTTDEMKMMSTFIDAGWDSEPIWTIDEGVDYPRLWWENKPGRPITSGPYGGGSGEPNDPYLIYTAEHLNTIGGFFAFCNGDWAKHFKLMEDIDLSDCNDFNIIGTGLVIPGDPPTVLGNPFSGTFDGNGHEICNFTYDSNDRCFVGLFGNVWSGSHVPAQIKDLGLRNPIVRAGSNVAKTGSLVGSLSDRGTISGCYSEGGSVSGPGCGSVGGLVGTSTGTLINSHASCDVSGERIVGGLVGWPSYPGRITNCYSSGTVSGGWSIGGLAGVNWEAVISDCHSVGNVLGTGWSIGGLVGENQGAISNCYSSGNVSGTAWVGGLAGVHLGLQEVSNCYSTGNVSGESDVGGLVGVADYWWGSILYCYSTGSVVGTTGVGGLVGYCGDTIVSMSFWDIETSGEPNMCGSGDCDPNYGKTTAEMHQQSTFEDWDFIHTWNMGENQTYPYLRTVPASDINKDRITNFLDLCIVAEQWCNEQ